MKGRIKVLKATEYLNEVIRTSVKLEVKLFQIPKRLQRQLTY